VIDRTREKNRVVRLFDSAPNLDFGLLARQSHISAMGSQDDGHYCDRVRRDALKQTTCAGVPEFYSSIPTSRSEGFTILAERHGPDILGVSGQCASEATAAAALERTISGQFSSLSVDLRYPHINKYGTDISYWLRCERLAIYANAD